jgi:hypothetical protein
MLAGLVVASICGAACAQDNFRVSIVLAPERIPADVPADFPMPPQARALGSVGHAQRFVYAGSSDNAKHFYDLMLPRLGYRLTRIKPGGSVWERSNVSTELQFHPVVGGQQEATLIRLTVTGQAPLPGSMARWAGHAEKLVIKGGVGEWAHMQAAWGPNSNDHPHDKRPRDNRQ